MESLKIYEEPKLRNPHMVLGFSGWMDGGNVSTGTVEYLRDKLKARKFAEIDPKDFYILSFPGSMEVSSLFRPQIKIENGTLKDMHFSRNEFFCATESDLILFSGKEPNLRWEEYAGCILEVAKRFKVKQMCFVGSVGGPVPHTREPRVLSTVSSEKAKSGLKDYGVKFTNYEGPGSITSLLSKRCKDEGLEMINFVAEIPFYVQTKNPRCIAAIIRRLTRLLEIDINVDDLGKMSDELQERLNKAIEAESELGKQVARLESLYDEEIFDAQMKDVEAWFKERGITF